VSGGLIILCRLITCTMSECDWIEACSTRAYCWLLKIWPNHLNLLHCSTDSTLHLQYLSVTHSIVYKVSKYRAFIQRITWDTPNALNVLIVVVVEVNIIKVALSHFCSRTSVQSDSVSVARQVTVRRWQTARDILLVSRKGRLEQHSLQFPSEDRKRRRVLNLLW